MGSSGYEVYFNYVTEYGIAPDDFFLQNGMSSTYILTEDCLPEMHYNGMTFLGWSLNGTLLKVGDTINLPAFYEEWTLIAVWQKPTTYVLVDKSDLVAMADSVREATGSEETFDVGELKNAVINTINNSGLTSAMLTMQDVDERCTLCYQTVTGDKVVVKAPAFNSIYEIGVPSIIALFDGYGGAASYDNCIKLYGSANEAAFYATGDCRICFYGK